MISASFNVQSWPARKLGNVLLWMAFVLSPGVSAEESSGSFPSLPEIVTAIRENLPSISQADLDRAALQGILTEFQTQVDLAGSLSPSEAEPTEESLALTRYYENAAGYVAVPTIEPAAAQSIENAVKQLDGEHILQGLVLDLRHVSGASYDQIPLIAKLFSSSTTTSLDWGDGPQSVEPQTKPFAGPILALVDETTRGAGEVLAAVIRSARIGLLVGRKTAGEAKSYTEVPLATGHTLRLATGRVTIDNDESIASEGLVPDILVTHSSSPRPASNDSQNQTASEQALEEGAPLKLPTDDEILLRAFEVLKGINIVKQRHEP